MSNLDLKLQAQAVVRLAEALMTAMEVTEEDRHLIADSETDLFSAAAKAVDQIAKLEADIIAVDALAKKYAARVKTLEARKDRIRAGLADAMDIAGLKTLRLPTATVGMSASQPTVIVTDEGEVPPWFFDEKVVRTIDKKAVAESLKAGNAVPGCVLGNIKTTIRILR